MSITDFRIYLAEAKFDGQASNPKMTWWRKQAVLIQLTDTEGFSGWGECWTFDQSADALVRFIQTELRGHLLGQDVESIAETCSRLYSDAVLSGRHGILSAALSGINCALWDIKSKRIGLPLWQVFGKQLDGEALRAVPVYASGGLYMRGDDPQILQAVVSGYVEQGFRTVKMKFGGKEFEDDLDRISEVRRGIGQNINLILDAVYSLDRQKAERWLPYWKDLGVQAVQAPFDASDWESMIWLNQDCGMPVMAFEAETRYEIFRALLQAGAIGIMQFSPVAVGGIDASRRFIDLAAEHGKMVSLQCSSTWMAELIAMHLAGASDNVEHVEYHQFHRLMFDLAEPTYTRLVDGNVILSSTPGLGLAPPLDRLRDVTSGLPDL